ncbi:MAG TPA: ABC transporter substrate-binding protein, partial [Burkholderiaceae bacterium]|nr:ABC transporter substrate-binding protein [Burkholderiaceae bacterium]
MSKPMGKTRPFAAALLCLAATLSGHAAGAAPVQLKDDRGQSVTLPDVPRRIVSLLPSLTESICALGECARLVGVDRYSNFPASVQSLP